MIVDERFSCYMNSLDPGHSPFLENLEQEAKAAYVPIIRRQMQSFLRMFLTMQQPKESVYWEPVPGVWHWRECFAI